MRKIGWVLWFLLIVSGAPAAERVSIGSQASTITVFDGKPKVLVVNGYSTSFKWPAILQAKIDKLTGDKRVIEVKPATKGGTPIAKWMDVHTGERLAPWKKILTPALNDPLNRPVIVLAQQSLQWVWTKREIGIVGKNDRNRIVEGADVLGKYVTALKKDGAAAVFIAMHIYKEPMEPEIGNERLALAEVLKRKIEHLYAGPDVWEPTKARYPAAFAADLKHPNELGAEIMAQQWFETLLKHDGLEVPVWSVRQTEQAITKDPQQATGGFMPRRPAVLKKYDTNGDGKLSREEREVFEKARRLRKEQK